MNEYIDVRGKHPVYIKGLIAFELNNFIRSVPLNIARLEYLRSIDSDVVVVRYE